MKKILVGVDGSEASWRAVELAAELAEGFGARLILANVAVPAPYPSELVGAERDRLEAAQRRESEQLLLKTADRLRLRRATVGILPLLGVAFRALLEAADEEDADLLVLGSQGKGAVQRLLVGSVADRVVHLSQKPVLVVR